MPVGSARRSLNRQRVESAIPDSGVSRYTFDNADTSGPTAVDVWNGNDGTINGATTGASGANQTYSTAECYSFDGVDDNVDIPDSLLSSDASGRSFALWINADDVGSDTDRKRAIQLNYFGLVQLGVDGAGNADIRVNDGNAVFVSFTNSLDTTWHHLCGVYDGVNDDVIAYFDGVQTNSSPFSGSWANESVTNSTVAGLTEYFDGLVDDVRVYDKALTSTEVSNLYNTGSISG